MVRFAVCDDKKAELDCVANKIREYYDDDCEIIKYEDGESLLADSRTQFFDAMFLDIVMPGLNGMELAKKIREENRNVKIVFVTNKEELAHEGYLYEAFRFVRKSKLDQELLETAESLKKHFGSANEYLVLKTPDGTITRAVKDIKYFEVKGHYVTMLCNGEERVCGTMKAFESSLNKNGFIRIHKGYLVNFRYIYTIQKNNVILTDGKTLPLSRNRANTTKKMLWEFTRNRLEPLS